MAISIDVYAAFIIVDVQKDFCPGGALAVKRGDEVVRALNQYIPHFLGVRAPIFLTRDWHPRNHVSFKERGGPWPPHCVQGTKGADFHPDLRAPNGAFVISKGFLLDQDAYSGFQGTDLEAQLREKKVRRIFVGGLATDYCVKHTVLDSLKCGFETYLLVDAIRGVDVKRGDSTRAVEEMLQAGAKKIKLGDLASPIKLRHGFMYQTRGRRE